MVKKKTPSKVAVKAQRTKKAPQPGPKQELTRLGAALRAMGGFGGTALGNMIGMGTTGGNFGTGLGASLSKWLGSGDYVVSANSITQKAAAGTIPAMHKDGQSILVRHREFLTEIRGARSFTVRNEFDLNPGLTTTFPWLAGIAQQYAQYRIRGMVFHYVPTSGNAVSSTNAALGTVMIQTSYRATEAAPTSKIEMLNEYWSSEAKPSEEFCHPIECDPKENPFNVQYIRSGALPATENQLMYDLGRTTVAVSGQQADDIVLGDLWVTYEIELKKPVLTNINNSDLQTFGSSATANINNTTPLGTNMATVFDTMPVPLTYTGTRLIFPRGNVGTFQLTLFYTGCTSISTFTTTLVTGTGLGGEILPVVGGVNTVTSTYTVGTGAATVTCFVSITNPDLETQVQYATGGLVGVTTARMVVTEINPALRV